MLTCSPKPRSPPDMETASAGDPLLPGLPDDIALLCLARVPRRSHHLLRCVSKRWNEAASSDDFALCRKSNGLQEPWVYATCTAARGRNCYYVLDPSRPRRGSWMPLPDAPPQCAEKMGMCVEALGTKLFLLGGCYGGDEDDTDEVYCFDALKNKWEQVASMPKARSFFSSTVLSEVLCVTDLLEETSPVNAPSWDIYNPVSKTWESFEDEDLVDSLSPLRKPWPKLGPLFGKTEFKFCSEVVVDGSHYALLNEMSGTKLVRWTSAEEGAAWEHVCRLSPLLTAPPCKLAVVGHKLFVVGRCLSTVIIDVDEVTRGKGLLFTASSLPALDKGLSIISCHTIFI